jgi:hypothetical protein
MQDSDLDTGSAALGASDLDRICKQFPVAQSVQLFKLPSGTIDSLVGAFYVRDIKLLLQALERVPIGAEQIFEEADAVA